MYRSSAVLVFKPAPFEPKTGEKVYWHSLTSDFSLQYITRHMQRFTGAQNLASRAGTILAGECLVFSLVAIFIYYSSGSGEEKEICTKGVNDGQKKIEGRGRGHRNYSYLFLPSPSPPPPPPSTITSTVQFKSNMAGRINNHDLVTS